MNGLLTEYRGGSLGSEGWDGDEARYQDYYFGGL